MSLKEKLSSRKFWLALMGAVMPIVVEYTTGSLGWEQATTSAIGILCAYILGQAYQDGQREKALGS